MSFVPLRILSYRQVGIALALACGAMSAGCPGFWHRGATGQSQAPQPAEVTLGALQLLTDKTLTLPPDHFAPGGALFGVTLGDRCQVFRPDRGLFMGEYPAAACAVWPAALRKGGASLRELQPKAEAIVPSAPDSRLASPSGTGEAVWRGAELTVWAGPRPLSRYVPRCEQPCGPISSVVWSPDGELLALAHSADPRIVILRAHDGAIVRELRLATEFAAVPGLLAWSPSGLVAVAGIVAPPGEEPVVELGSEGWTLHKKKPPPLRLHVWPNQGRAATLALDDSETGSNFLALDPGGRFLFNTGTGPHDAITVEGFDLRSGIERIFFYRNSVDLGQVPTHNETYDSVWLPGPYPLFETIEAHVPEEGTQTPTYTAWRLYTRPDIDWPRLERIDLSAPPPAQCESRRVLPDGRTVGPADPNDSYDSCGRNAMDPSRRLRGVARDELQRVDDGLRLRVGERGCLNTDTGYYSCLDLAAERRYVVGRNPLTALFLHGDQLAPLLFHSQLLDEYMQGRPLTAPAKDTLLGLPPRISLEYLKPGETPEAIFEVSDGGSGVGQLRLYRDGQLLEPAIALRVGRQVLSLRQLERSCRPVRAYACNATGFMCSTALPISPCKSVSVAQPQKPSSEIAEE